MLLPSDTQSGIAGSENMYWTQWKNRQLPLRDHKWNISLLPSTCDCLPSLSILHERLSTQPATAGCLESPQISWRCHPTSPNSASDHAPPLYPRISRCSGSSAGPQCLRSSGHNRDLQLHSDCADNPRAFLPARAPSLSPSYRANQLLSIPSTEIPWRPLLTQQGLHGASQDLCLVVLTYKSSGRAFSYNVVVFLVFAGIHSHCLSGWCTEGSEMAPVIRDWHRQGHKTARRWAPALRCKFGHWKENKEERGSEGVPSLFQIETKSSVLARFPESTFPKNRSKQPGASLVELGLSCEGWACHLACCSVSQLSI